MAATAHGLRRLGGLLLDAVLPPRCVSCTGPVAEVGGVCSACWSRIELLAPPLCARCGVPLAQEVAGESVCGSCLRSPPAWRSARAVFAYDEASRDLVIALKHRDRLEAAPMLGRWMARAGAELLAEADILVPVPLHWTRLFLRRFNQAAVLAKEIGAASGVAVVPDLLVRRRRTPSQGRLTRTGRARNVRGAFAVSRRRRAAVVGARVVLVDDVLTTGATLAACTRVLLRAGAARVDVLTLARVN